jgi:hypothetical protein
MGRLNRFVQPDVVRLEISDGDWIEIKRELTVGEQKGMAAKAVKRMSLDVGETTQYDWDPVSVPFAAVEAYLVGWSFSEQVYDKDGKPEMENGKPVTKPIELSPEAIRSLDGATFDEIQGAINNHVEKLAEGKKASGGKGKSAKT